MSEFSSRLLYSSPPLPLAHSFTQPRCSCLNLFLLEQVPVLLSLILLVLTFLSESSHGKPFPIDPIHSFFLTAPCKF